MLDLFQALVDLGLMTFDEAKRRSVEVDEMARLVVAGEMTLADASQIASADAGTDARRALSRASKKS